MLKDNRIPPRGFTNAAFAAFDGEPISASYADGQHWDDVVYPVGKEAVQAEVTLYYQTASREYVEFLRDEDVTTSSGGILHDLWSQVDRSTPVEMASLLVERSPRAVRRCRATVARAQRAYRLRHARAWAGCFGREVGAGACDTSALATTLAAEVSSLRDRVGGADDAVCAGANLTPASLGHDAYCPRPCGDGGLFDVGGLAACAMCVAEAVNDAALGAAYGTTPPALPSNVSAGAIACQNRLDRAALGLAGAWADALAACARRKSGDAGGPRCADDPHIRRAKARAAALVRGCGSFSGLRGCGTAGDATAVATCIERAVGEVVGGYAEVAAP